MGYETTFEGGRLVAAAGQRVPAADLEALGFSVRVEESDAEGARVVELGGDVADPEVRTVFGRLAPVLADGSALEFTTSEGGRFRWMVAAGRVVEQTAELRYDTSRPVETIAGSGAERVFWAYTSASGALHVTESGLDYERARFAITRVTSGDTVDMGDGRDLFVSPANAAFGSADELTPGSPMFRRLLALDLDMHEDGYLDYYFPEQSSSRPLGS